LRDGTIKTIAGTGHEGYNGDDRLGTSARLCYPKGLFVTDNDQVLFADCENHRIRMIDRYGFIRTIAGTGVKGCNYDNILATQAELNEPTSVFKYRNEVYFTDCGNHRIRKIMENGKIVTIAGTGQRGYNGDNQLATIARLCCPCGLHVHDGEVYFSDQYNSRIRKILSNGTIQTIAGTGKTGYNGDNILATQSCIYYPSDIFVSNCGNVYFADTRGNRIRMIDSQSGLISTIAGNGQEGYLGDVPFDFERFPHIGPPRPVKPFSKRQGQFVSSYHDIVIECSTTRSETE